MSNIVAWAQLTLGVIHIVFGIIRFKAPLADAVSAGFIGQFQVPEARRTAFWFLMCGPLLILSGHIAVHAVTVNDLALLRIVGIYTLLSSIVGVVAFPKSPFWCSIVLSPLLIAAGYGLL
jgi:uncharacterized membrane protein HdeD (DUF308 family)